MAFFKVDLDPELARNLDDAARMQRADRSEIMRQALSEYFASNNEIMPDDDALFDDWGEFSQSIQDAQIQVITDTLEALPDEAWISREKTFNSITDALTGANWEQGIEAVYQVFRNKVITKSHAYEGNPQIEPTNASLPYAPVVSAGIGFASDDRHVITVPLIQLFFEYHWNAGESAFAEIPAIWAAAKARVDAGETKPTSDEYAAARRGIG